MKYLNWTIISSGTLAGNGTASLNPVGEDDTTPVNGYR